MHYRNGRLAVVGDRVIGKGYNYGIVAGTVLSITTGCSSCNCVVGFLKTVPIDDHHGLLVALRRNTNVGTSGELNAVVYQEEYTQCVNLLLVDDAWGGEVCTSDPDEEKGDKDDSTIPF